MDRPRVERWGNLKVGRRGCRPLNVVPLSGGGKQIGDQGNTSARHRASEGRGSDQVRHAQEQGEPGLYLRVLQLLQGAVSKGAVGPLRGGWTDHPLRRPEPGEVHRSDQSATRRGLNGIKLTATPRRHCDYDICASRVFPG